MFSSTASSGTRLNSCWIIAIPARDAARGEFRCTGLPSTEISIRDDAGNELPLGDRRGDVMPALAKNSFLVDLLGNAALLQQLCKHDAAGAACLWVRVGDRAGIQQSLPEGRRRGNIRLRRALSHHHARNGAVEVGDAAR